MKYLMILFLLSVGTSSFSQKISAEDKKKMEEAQKKLEATKANMSPEARKQFEDMMENMGANKAMQNAQQGLTGGKPAIAQRTTDPNIIPDKIAVAKIAATPQNKTQLTAYLNPIFTETDKLMKAESKAAVKNLLNKGELTGKYAMVFWTHNELDKALYLLLNACLINPDDMVSLNNLGSLLTISGYADKSLPLLLYAQKLLPDNGTVLNNTGQALLSLGNVDKAKSMLSAAISKDTSNAEAYRSMALIAQKQGDNTACAGYLENAISHGGATTQNINLLQKIAPATDMSRIYTAIRNSYKQYYKDHSITKRFIVPEVPGSYETAVAAYRDINTFFQDLDATITEATKNAAKLNKEYEKQFQENVAKRMAQTQQLVANAGKPGMGKAIQDMKASMINPFLAQAEVMLNAIDNPQYSISYFSRIKREADNTAAGIIKLKEGLKKDYDDKIDALQKEYKKLNTGEAQDAANARAMQIEKQICDLKQGRQNEWLSKSADIYNGYIRNMEDLLNQRLQERLFWNTIAMQSMQDPTAVNYQFYVGYLKDLNSFKKLFPFYVDGGFSKACAGDNLKPDYTKGKMHEWEREHCEVDFGFDTKVVSGKMNCEGFSITADIKASEFTYTRSFDPVTWETTGHSLSAKAGKDKSFEIGKGIGAHVGATVETTIQFDGNMNPVDLIVQGSAGAGVSGPGGISTSADLGSVTVSVNGGFNSSGPGFTSFGNSFLKN